MKKLLRLLLVLALLFVVLLVVGAVFIDGIAETAIEEGGTYALGVETSVEDADVGLFTGGFGLTGLAIENPEGFEAQNVLSLSAVRVDVSLASLTKDTVVLPELSIEGLALEVEYGPDGSNLAPLLESLERFQSPGGDVPPGEEAPPEPTGGGKKFIVEKVLIRDVVATVRVQLGEGEPQVIPLELPDIELENVGTAEGGQSMGELFGTLLTTLVDEVRARGGDLLPAELLKDLEEQLGELEALGTERAQGLVDDAKARLEEQAGELGKEAGKALDEGLEGFFGNKKKP